jgi:homoserine O-acetyltransferase/O-succinyltransferase
MIARFRDTVVGALLVLALLPGVTTKAADLIVEKKTFEMSDFATVGGETIKKVTVGWETAGTLNADKSNAILITHYFSGTSHAFGKYAASDALPGYWDAIIGPGKAIDTDKYFVISSDTLVNLNVRDPHVVTTGPASIDPATGKAYGMNFPIVRIKDFVNVQKALIESLGITKLKAVVGASMGALQAYEWAASYPDMVDRIVAVIGAPGADPFLIGWLGLWAEPIRLDPKWNGGDYYDKEPPLAGLTAALKILTLHANHWDWAVATQGGWAEQGKDPGQAFDNKFKIEATLDAAAKARAGVADANHFLYLAKANQLASADAGKIKAPTLILYTPTDLVFYSPLVEQSGMKILSAQTGTIVGPNGHLNGVLGIAQAADRISSFLSR